MIKFPNWQKENWKDMENNPLIGKRVDEKGGSAIGDPQVLLPGQFDEKWHIFYHGFLESGIYYHHMISCDGVKWELVDMWQWDVGPCYMFCDGGKWILYYTHITDSDEQEKTGTLCYIKAKTTTDFKNWSEPVTVLLPELDWELEGRKTEIRNPCVIKLDDGRYRIYYSAGTVWLEEAGYEEPKYIGFADAPTPFGPFVKHPTPVIVPDSGIYYKNLGAGGIKVYRYGEDFIALYNGVYVDSDKLSRSAISVAMSKDGIEWADAPYNPIISPSTGWKRAIVYQLDLVTFEGKLRLYYNARDEWHYGVERIGCSTLEWNGPAVSKMWELPKKK